MKNIHIIILFFICGSIQASPLTSQLEEKIRNTPSQEYIRIYIALTDVYDFLSMEEALTELNKIERHEYVKQELKSFHLESQENIMSQINELKEEGLITKVKHLWITNVIICESTGEAI
jgi:CRISPR/Cas system-associated endonuclease/helicase Cas3